MYVTVEEAKDFLGVYYTEKDALIAQFIEAAEAHVANFLGGPLSDWQLASDNSPPDLDGGELKPNVKLGILYYVADFWANREITVTGTIVAVNQMAENVLHFERKGLGV